MLRILRARSLSPLARFRRQVGIMFIAGAFGLAPAARVVASPATESDINEFNDGGADITLTTSYQTDYVFRGVRQAEDTLRLKLKGRVSAGPADLSIGIASAVPFESSNAGIDEPREIDGFLKARFHLIGRIEAEAGLTYYAFVGAEDTPGSEPDSVEFFAGVRLPVILPLYTRLYYDVEFQNVTLETEARWRETLLNKRLAIEFSGRVGFVHVGDDADNITAAAAGARTLVENEPATGFAVKDNRGYYDVGIAVSGRLAKGVKLGANVNFAGTTGEFVFDNQADDEVVYGGVSMTVGL